MDDNSRDRLTLARRFLEPSNSTHRQYEALRSFFVDRVPSAEAAARFGYTPGSFRVLVHQFRNQPGRDFFVPTARQGRPPGKQKRLREQVVALRKQNLSVHDISRALAHDGEVLSPAAVAAILEEEGFAKLPRRGDDERPDQPRPVVAEAADVRQLDLTPRHFRTKFGGLFLFLPGLVSADLDAILARAGLPGSKMIPAACAVRSLLALKLFGNARHSHVMSSVLDEGLALFAGLNVVPKRSSLTEYSSRVEPACYPKLMRRLVRRGQPPRPGVGDVVRPRLPHDPLPRRGRPGREALRLQAEPAPEGDARVPGPGRRHAASSAMPTGSCARTSRTMRSSASSTFWKQRTGHLPEELIFDSKLTTYANLDKLNRMGIPFITLRRRTPKLLAEIARTPTSAWRRVELESVSRAYKTPRVLDRRITLNDYDGPLRQLTIAELGHEEPTLLLTNQLGRSASHLIGRYARRMLIENNIEDGVDFFHMDALSSAVAMKISCDLQLTLMASSLYRLLAVRIGHGYESAKSRHLFRDFIDASAGIAIDEDEVVVRFQRRAHNPLLVAAGFDKTDIKVPWLGGKRLRLVFGESAPWPRGRAWCKSRN